MKVEVYNLDGSKSGETIEIEDSVFCVEPNDHVIYLNVKAYLANQRQGTHKAKERNEVSGGGRKPWRQKGRGTARAGTSRSPLWVGGGRIFGPKPRNYRQKINRKVSKLARRSALSYKIKSEQFIVINDFEFEAPKTKEFVKIMTDFNMAGKKLTLLTDGLKSNVYKSSRNIPKVNVLEANKASTYDILNNQVLMLQKSAVRTLESILN